MMVLVKRMGKNRGLHHHSRDHMACLRVQVGCEVLARARAQKSGGRGMMARRRPSSWVLLGLMGGKRLASPRE